MTLEEKKWLSIQNEIVLRMSNKAIGMGELEKFFSFVNKVISNKNSLQQQNTALQARIKELEEQQDTQ